jgi:hypothetical protein
MPGSCSQTTLDLQIGKWAEPDSLISVPGRRLSDGFIG